MFSWGDSLVINYLLEPCFEELVGFDSSCESGTVPEPFCSEESLDLCTGGVVSNAEKWAELGGGRETLDGVEVGCECLPLDVRDGNKIFWLVVKDGLVRCEPVFFFNTCLYVLKGILEEAWWRLAGGFDL